MKKQITTSVIFAAIAITGCSDSSSSSSTSSDTPSLGGSLGSSAKEHVETTIKEDGSDMLNYGQLNATISSDSLLKVFEYGDIVTVVVAEKDTFDAPVVGTWNDVSSGEYLVMAVQKQGYITMGKNYGQTGVDFGIAKSSDGKAETLFILRDDVDLPIKVEITMKEKGAYIENLKMREKQNQGKKRENYPDLSDAEYANFRAVATPGMGKNVLYRSASPIDPSLGRNLFADSLAKEAGIKVFMNLTDNENSPNNYPDYKDSYYSKQHIAFLGLPAAFSSKLFKDGLAKGLRYMAENDGPYLVHCREGKDRAGYVSAILEALMGAGIEEIKKDYSKTYTNYYNVVDGKQDPLTAEDVEWFEQIIVVNLRVAFAAEGIKAPELEKKDLLTAGKTPLLMGFGAADSTSEESEWFKEMSSVNESVSNSEDEITEYKDLAAATEKYLQVLGLTKDEIEALKKKLK